MCAITGLIDFTRKSDTVILEKMSDSMIHRGPDGSGSILLEEPEATVGFGHRRLAIIDLTEHGKQPMRFEHLWICFNGEIYNYQEIKKELAALGHQFVGNSDTEMILHAYAQWGEACIHRFRGMFAFVIFDTVKRNFFCVRDRAGVKPFFYYYNKGLFLFASELKAFHAHPSFQKELNKDAISAFLQYGNIPAPHCIFEHCQKLKPGHSMSFSMDELSVKAPIQKQYWSVYTSFNKEKTSLTYEEAKEETKAKILESCQLRMVSDVPVGVFLSGGYDSTCVASLLQSNQTEQLRTFTISVPDIGLNEAPYAQDVANLLGTKHTEIECSHKEAIELIPQLPHFYDEPFADSSAIPTTLVSLMAKKSVTVALSADGGDELFAGYNRYDYLHQYASKMDKIPNWGKKTIAWTMDKIPSERIPVLKHKYNFHNRYEKIKSLLGNYSKNHILMSLSEQFTDGQLVKMLNFPFDKLKTAYTSTELSQEHYSILAYAMAIDFETYLPDDILQKVDRATMTASLEGREPLLDHQLVEWAAQLPDSYKYKDGVKKRILRDIVHDFIPKETMDRPKMGFAIPIASWLTSDLKDLVHSYINQEKIEQQGLFHWSEINRIVNAFYAGKKEYDFKMWYLLMFQLWYEKWME
jgi:asparagine synthase (glutamine-hydrolysing)